MSIDLSLQNPESEEQTDVLQTWREAIFNSTIRVIGYVGSVAYLIGMAFAYKEIPVAYFLAYTIAFIWVMATAFIKRIPTVYRAYNFVVIIFVLGILSSLEKDSSGDGRTWLILSAVLAVIFLGRKAGLAFTIAATLTWIFIGYLFISPNDFIPPVFDRFSVGHWAGTTVSLLVASIIIIRTMGALLFNLNKTIEESVLLAKEANEQSLELRRQRNALEKRSRTLEATAKISRQLSVLVDENSIAEALPTLLLEAFNLNSVDVFFLNTEKVLRPISSAGRSEQAKLTGEHHLSRSEDAVVLAITREKAITCAETDIFLSSSLPNTLSYIAMPLRGHTRILGTLLLQSDRKNAFDSEGVTIFQFFADQVSSLLENVTLLAEKEKTLELERRAYGKITRKAWSDFISEGNYGAYRRDKLGVSVLPAKPFSTNKEDELSEKVPITIRGNVIGYIDAQKPDNRAWTASEKELLRILTSRLESAIDGARLYQDTQEQAMRERIIAETSSQVRESLDIEGVLGAAALELRKGMGLAEAEIWLSPEYLQGEEDNITALKDESAETSEKKA